MYSEKIEQLIKATLADGVLTEKEKQVLFKRAQEDEIDLDEFEVVLNARLVELQKEKQTQTAPKPIRYGDVRKCPTCGALVPALAVSCAECGYEFTGIEASTSAQTLSKKIAEIKEFAFYKKNEIPPDFSSNKRLTLTTQIDSYADEQIKSLVNNYPIPNSKNDLFDLILFLNEHYDYKKKCDECLNRAKLLYPNDPLFIRIIEQITIERKKSRKKIITIVGGVILFLLILILLASLRKQN